MITIPRLPRCRLGDDVHTFGTLVVVRSRTTGPFYRRPLTEPSLRPFDRRGVEESVYGGAAAGLDAKRTE